MRLLVASVGPLADLGVVPGGDLVSPAQQGATRASGPRQGRTRSCRSRPRRVHERQGQVGVVVVVYGTDDFLGVPGGADLAVGVAGVEEAEQLGAARARRGVRRLWSTIGGPGREDRSCGLGGRPSRSGPAGGTHPAWRWRTCTRGTGRRPGRRRAASGRTQPDTDPTDQGWPSATWSRHAWPLASSHSAGPSALRPGTTSRSCPPATSTIEVDQCWRSERPQTHEQGLIQAPSAVTGADPARVVDQRSAVGDHGVVDGVPVASQLHRRSRSPNGRSDRPVRSPTARPGRSSPTGPQRYEDPPTSTVVIGTVAIRARPAQLAPAQPGRSTERRQIDQLDRLSILDLWATSAPQTDRALPGLLDMHRQRGRRDAARLPARSLRAIQPAAHRRA